MCSNSGVYCIEKIANVYTVCMYTYFFVVYFQIYLQDDITEHRRMSSVSSFRHHDKGKLTIVVEW